MTEQSCAGDDQWSRWLTSGRFQGQTPSVRAHTLGLLATIRERVLDGAHLRPGDQVLDLGAGTGLLTLGAAPRVAPTGTVTAVDISHAALTAINPASTDPLDGPVYRIVGDGTRLPVTADAVDVVVGRSVLIYIDNLAGAFAEIARILRPGGRVSLFEPINKRRHHDASLEVLTRAERDAIERLGRSNGTARTILAFDEHAAHRYAERAGLTVDALQFDVVTDQLTDLDAVDGYLNRPPNPQSPSPLQQIGAALGSAVAQRYRDAWYQSVADRGAVTWSTPVLYMTARQRT